MIAVLDQGERHRIARHVLDEGQRVAVGNVFVAHALQNPHRTKAAHGLAEQQVPTPVLDEIAGDAVGLVGISRRALPDALLDDRAPLRFARARPHQRLGEIDRRRDEDHAGEARRLCRRRRARARREARDSRPSTIPPGFADRSSGRGSRRGFPRASAKRSPLRTGRPTRRGPNSRNAATPGRARRNVRRARTPWSRPCRT